MNDENLKAKTLCGHRAFDPLEKSNFQAPRTVEKRSINGFCQVFGTQSMGLWISCRHGSPQVYDGVGAMYQRNVEQVRNQEGNTYLDFLGARETRTRQSQSCSRPI